MTHDDERTLGDLLVDASPEPPRAAHASRLVADGMARGRMLRRRRRAGAALATVAVLGLGGAGLSLLAPGTGGAGGDVASAPSPDTPTADRLASLLPPGHVTDLRDDDGADFRRGSVLYDGLRVYVYVYRASTCNSGPLITDIGCYDLKPGATEPGTDAVTETSPAPGGPDRQHAEADLVRPDGWRVAVVATNDAVADGPVLQRAPALRRPQLLEIVRADGWLPGEKAAASRP